jgi:hypothetical protein
VKKSVLVVGMLALTLVALWAAKPVAPPLSANLPFPDGEVGVPYFWPVYVGGKPPYKCSIGGALPPGLYLNKSCYIVGTPTQASVGGLLAVR